MSDERVFTVSGSGAGDFRTITEAIRTAAAGDVIVVKIGSYDEKVVMDKEVHLQGDSSCEAADVIITGGMVCLAGGSVQRLSITQFVDIRSGSIKFENVDISQGYDGVRVCTGATPTFVRCQIHAGQQGGDGLYFQEGTKGVVEECEIYGNRMNGVHVRGGEVTLRRNRIHSCQYGIFFRKGGKGLVEENIIDRVSTFGIYVIGGSDPVIHKNTLSQCQVHCVMISQGGAGALKDNNITGSVRILKGCAPTLGMNSIQGRLDNENLSGTLGGSPTATQGVM
eukprot:PhF_6_TR29188/c0_g1_i1/m.42704/K10297/FBXO11; F-box protein 11